MQEVISPLAQIIRRAAESKADGPIANARKRLADASDEVVLLLDVSSSMGDYVGTFAMRKCDHLAVALKDVLMYHPKIRIITFGMLVNELDDPARLPAPAGGTPMAKALSVAQKYKPRKTIIVTDGMPTDGEENVRAAAQRLTGVIDAVYCGHDGHKAAEFLQSLCRDTGGTQMTWDGYKGEIGSHIRGLIGAPAK